MADCVRCARPVTDSGYACHRCANGLAAALLRTALLAREVNVTVARLDRMRQGGHATSIPLAFAWDAADASWAVRNTIAVWAGVVVNGRGCDPPGRWVLRHLPSGIAGPAERVWVPDRSVVGWLMWLAGQAGWLRTQPIAEQALDELFHAVDLLRRTVDKPPVHWYAGTCRALDEEGTRCERELYARTGTDWVRCPQCGTEYEAAARKEWLLDQARDTLAHAGLIATALAALGLDVRADRIRKWSQRGLLATKGVGDHGWPTYRIGDVLDLLTRLAEKAS